MEAVNDKPAISGAVPLRDGNTINDHLFGFVATPADFPGIDGIFEDIADGNAGPVPARRRGDPESIEPVSDNVRTDKNGFTIFSTVTIGVELEDKADDIGLRRDDTKSEALTAFYMDALIAIRDATGDDFPLLGGSKTTGIKTTVDSAVFLPGHKKPELKILLVELIRGIIDFHGGYYLSGGILESAGDCALVNRVTTGKTLHLHNENTRPAPRLNFTEELGNDRAGGDGLAGDDFTVDFGYIVVAALCELQKGALMTGKSFALTGSLGLNISAGLAKIDTVFFHTSPKRKPLRTRGKSQHRSHCPLFG